MHHEIKMIKFKELLEKTKLDDNIKNTHVEIATNVVNEFLKSEDGKNIQNEIKSFNDDDELEN